MPAVSRLLTVNAGSSSVRLAAYDFDDADAPPLATRHEQGALPDPRATLAEFIAPLGDAHWTVVHRVVHGGASLPPCCLVDAAVEHEIEALAPLAPLHNPPALAWLRAARDCLGPQTPQVAVFDTGFFHDLPPVARTYPLPRALNAKYGLRRYGFHGLAHHALWRRWTALRPDLPRGGRVISFQLGSGCSVAAVANGRALDTSMGFSPLEGLVMATRGGDLDPGVLLHLTRDQGMSQDALAHLLSHEAGLAGLSGRGGDLRELLAADDADARLAVDVYCYRARKYLGAYLAVLGGADAVLFGGGVGENAPAVRAGILAGGEWAGISLDPAANRAARGVEADIARRDSRVALQVLRVDEARELADAARALLAGGA